MQTKEAAIQVTPMWLTYKQAEAYANLSRTRLWELASAGEVEAAHIGRAVRINRDSLDSFMRRSAKPQVA